MKSLRLVAVLLMVALATAFSGLVAVAQQRAGGDVKFRGTVIQNESHPPIGCYGMYMTKVRIEQILQDPKGLLQGKNSVWVCYKNPLHLMIGERVEVYGFYWTMGPRQLVGNVVASHLKRLPSFSFTWVLPSPSLIWLGHLGGGSSSALDVSDDGRVVVGKSAVNSSTVHAFLWTRKSGMRDLGTLGGPYSEAWGVSADGRVVVGESSTSQGPPKAFYYMTTPTIPPLPRLIALPSPGSLNTRAHDVSPDGSIVVGCFMKPEEDKSWPVVWRRLPSGMWEWRYLSDDGIAWAVSANGSWAVGRAKGRAARFDLRGEQPPQFLAPRLSTAFAVSANGQVVVGEINGHAFRWTEQGGLQDLGTLGGHLSQAWGVSGDGRVVVGWSEINNSGTRHAFIWTPQGGMKDLNEVYANLLHDGSYLGSAYAISSNGRFIVGNGYHAETGCWEAFLLDTGGFAVQILQGP